MPVVQVPTADLVVVSVRVIVLDVAATSFEVVAVTVAEDPALNSPLLELSTMVCAARVAAAGVVIDETVPANAGSEPTPAETARTDTSTQLTTLATSRRASRRITRREAAPFLCARAIMKRPRFDAAFF